MVRFTWLGLCGVMTMLSACGKSEGSSQPIPKTELPARIAKVVCEGMASCCQGSGHSFDVATCKAAYQAEVEDGVSELDNPNINYDAQAAGECIDGVAAAGLCGDVDDDDVPACGRVFAGKLAVGAVCVDSDECRQSPGQYVSCYSEDGLSQRVCTLEATGPSAPRGKLGDVCGGTCSEGSDCGGFVSAPVPAPGPGVPAPSSDPALCYRDDGLWCDYTAGTCARLLTQGDPCTDYDSCGGGSYCNFYVGICSLPVADGSACDGDDWCQSDNCVYPDGPGIGSGPSGMCLARGTVTAEQCTIDFGDSGDDSDSSGDPTPAP